jgi:hypothetical protein
MFLVLDSFPRPAMVVAADFVVNGVNDDPQLIVETKAKASASRDWAAQLRRNIFAHVSLPNAPYFLLASPERFYLWKNASPSAVAQPDYEIDAEEALRNYVSRLETPLPRLSENGFKFLIHAWLDDVASVASEKLAAPDQWLLDSGLFEAIRHGTIKSQGQP